MDRLEKALERARSERLPANSKDATSKSPVSTDIAQPKPSVTRSLTPKQAILEANRLVAGCIGHKEADLFRILRTKVQQMMARDKLYSIGVTSPNYGDGKTTIATNLALSLALDVKQWVCIADLDLRDPSLHQVLGLPVDKGLSDYLLDGAPLSECLVRPAAERILVLPNFKPIAGSSEMLGAPRMAELAFELKTRYADRIVIYDLPPVLPTDDTLGFLPNLDAVILVVREGMTSVEDLKRCLHTLGDTPLLGTVLNRSHWRDRSRNFVRSVKLRNRLVGRPRAVTISQQ